MATQCNTLNYKGYCFYLKTLKILRIQQFKMKLVNTVRKYNEMITYSFISHFNLKNFERNF